QLEVAVLDHQGQLAEPPLVRTDVDPVVLEPAGDGALAEQGPAPGIPRGRRGRGRGAGWRRGRGAAGAEAPDLDPGFAGRQVPVLDVDEADHRLARRQVDHPRALALAEHEAELGAVLGAIAEHDPEVDQLEIAVLDHHGQLVEPAVLAADLDPVVIDPAVDGALAEHDPAARVPHRLGRHRAGLGERGTGTRGQDHGNHWKYSTHGSETNTGSHGPSCGGSTVGTDFDADQGEKLKANSLRGGSSTLGLRAAAAGRDPG